jgi:hypothetical protein
MCVDNRTTKLAFTAAMMFLLGLGAPSVSAQVASIGTPVLNDIGALNWSDGTWYVRAILLDAGDSPIGAISNEVSFTSSSQYPSIPVTMTSSAHSTDTIHFYRSNVPIAPGDAGIEYFELLCGSSVVCDASSTSNIVLGENLEWQTETVVPVTLMAWTVE